MRGFGRLAAAGLFVSLGGAFAFQQPLVQGGGGLPPGCGQIWEVPHTGLGVGGTLKVTGVTNGKISGTDISAISGTNIGATVEFSCGNLAGPPAGQPPPTLVSITIKQVVIYVGGKAVTSPELTDLIYPFRPPKEPPRSNDYTIRFASTAFPNGPISIYATAHVVAYYDNMEKQPADVSTPTMNLTVYNQLLLLATKEREGNTHLQPVPETPLVIDTTQDGPAAISMSAAGNVASIFTSATASPALNHVIVNPNKAYNDYLKPDLVGTAGNNGALLAPTVFWAITHGISDGGWLSGTPIGFRPSYIVKKNGVPKEDNPIRTWVQFKEGMSSETYRAVYGSGSSTRQVPPMNVVLLFCCNTMPINSSYNAPLAFGVINPDLTPITDRAYLGFAGELFTKGDPSNKNTLADYCKQFATFLQQGLTVDKAGIRIQDPKLKFGFVQPAKVRGDLCARLANVYLYASEWNDPKNAAWFNSWYFCPGWLPGQ